MESEEIKPLRCPEGLNQEQQDAFWMAYAYRLAERSEAEGEVPVGAVVVLHNELIAEGWNQPIQRHDPTAHAEILALRRAGEVIENYRLVDATLYVTLEPCPMCAGAMVHARVKRLVYGAPDLRTGAAQSVFNLVDSPLLNHRLEVTAGVMQDACSQKMSAFFKAKREQNKALRAMLKKNSSS